MKKKNSEYKLFPYLFSLPPCTSLKIYSFQDDKINYVFIDLSVYLGKYKYKFINI